MKKILIIHTGGTIAMSENKETGMVVPEEKNPLHSVNEMLQETVKIETEDYLHLPSPHITPRHMLGLAEKINEKMKNSHFDGVVITHGTDTLEETAYLLDLLLHLDQPVVITGAMRSSNELGADGPHNLISAVRTAASDKAAKKGVIVVFNDEIHTAKNVTKTHSSNIATFQSPQYGAIGILTKREVSFHHIPAHREHFPVTKLSKKVLLVKAYAGMEESVMAHIASHPLDGLVLEAFGQGNVPPAIVPPLESLIEKNIPVVLVSRSYSGIVQDTYGYEGGGRQLKEKGVIFTNGLNGQKARLKLMAALEMTQDHGKLQEIFLR
ncbi:asparaginase [Thalassorhabdus alkalitolerans]|uniref:asparaginase n=1 Tax=Thalassorhabdus alkalitolerans TaxID=2282697 RepID=A0ABW0YRZ2_9BACI|nr:asparaginase [Thalassobacillus sp. C254]